jgi:hypothetical protein
MEPFDRGVREVEVGVILRTVAALALLGAAAIHFAVMGEHAGVSASHGAFFAVVAWLQVGLALSMLRPSRTAALATVAVNLGVLAVWIASRTAGIGIGGDGSPEEWGRIDGVAAALEGAAIVAAAGLAAPALVRRRIGTEVGYAGVGVAAVAVTLLTGLLFSPAWNDDIDDAAVAAGGHRHGHTDAPAAPAARPAKGSEHAHGGPATDEQAHYEEAKQAEIAFLFPDGDSKGWEDVENGVVHAHEPDVPEHEIPAATRAELRRQLALTLKAAEAYPTVAAAEAAGYRRAGPFTPGLGAHYVGGPMAGRAALTDAQIIRPSTIVYAGTDPDSPVVGFMYIALGGDASPEGFAGPNDHWHTHSGVCIRPSSDGAIDALGADGSIDEDDCREQGGSWMAVTQSLLHVWTVPSYTDPLGVFAHTNPAVTCPDGTYHTGSMGKLSTCLQP